MTLNYRKIKEIVEYFNVGELIEVVTTLESGHQSDSFHIKTDKGDFVLRQIYDSTKNVKFTMEVYNYFANHNIKTAKPVSTKEDTFSLPYEKSEIVIQSYIPGIYYDLLDKVDSLLSFYGRELGKVHQVSLNMVKEKGDKEFFTKQLDSISYVKEASEEYLPDNEFIREQYDTWEQEITVLPKEKLTRAVIHGDVGPKDFFFRDGKYSGIIDFNAAHLDYLLFDIAPIMMYYDLFRPERETQYYRFITGYLREGPIIKEELRYLHIFLRTRWLLQILYHQYRYVKGITQGSKTGKVKENLEGIRDGEKFLKITNATSKDYYFRVIRDLDNE